MLLAGPSLEVVPFETRLSATEIRCREGGEDLWFGIYHRIGDIGRDFSVTFTCLHVCMCFRKLQRICPPCVASRWQRRERFTAIMCFAASLGFMKREIQSTLNEQTWQKWIYKLFLSLFMHPTITSLVNNNLLIKFSDVIQPSIQQF